MPRCVRKGRPSSCTPHIYSEAELKRLLAAVPPATGRRSDIDATTLRMALLLLFGAGLRRGEALRLKLTDVDGPQSLLHIRGTKFFKTRKTGANAPTSQFPSRPPRRSPRHRVRPADLRA